MEITRMHIKKCKSGYSRKTKVLATVDIVFDDELLVRGIKLLDGKNGMFCAFPHDKVFIKVDGNKYFQDIVHPINNSFRQKVFNEVIKGYNNYN